MCLFIKSASLLSRERLRRRKQTKSAMILPPAFSKGNTLSLFVLILIRRIFIIISIGTLLRSIANGSSGISADPAEPLPGSATLFVQSISYRSLRNHSVAALRITSGTAIRGNLLTGNFCVAIDDALEQKPHDFNAFLALLSEQGFQVKNGKHLTFVRADFKQNIRMYTLGDAYSEDTIRAVIKGQRIHQPKKRRTVWDKTRPQTIIDIQAKLAAGMGEGYRRWATVENLKRMAKTKLYMDEHGFSYEAMTERKTVLAAKEKELSAKITEAQNRVAEINVLKTHIVNYSKTRDVYVDYRKSGYSKRYLEEHEPDIIIHKAAKKAFDELGLKKLPTIKSLQVEFAEKLTMKKEAYAELKRVRDELRDLAVHTANYEELRDLEEREKRKEKEHGRE